MPLNRDFVAALTPNLHLLPPERYEPPPETGRDELEMHRWQWTQFMLRGSFADRVLRAALEVNEAWYAGVGLVPWAGTENPPQVPEDMYEVVKKCGYVWGGLVLTTMPQPPYFLGDRLLWLGESQFPIVVRHARYWPEAMEVHESTLLGTATSWVQTTNNHPRIPGMDGCVTAAHVLGAGRGRYDIVDGNTLLNKATVKEFSPPCLDAAFLACPWPPAAMQSYVPQPPSAIAFGDPVTFDGATSSKRNNSMAPQLVTGYVTHVSAHAKHTGSGVPMILCHDGLGAPGDSGALVNVNGTPTAMHLGKITLDGGAGEESRGVFLHQVGHVMKLEFFR